MALLLNCHPRTVRRRALEQGLVSAGSPVYTTVQNEDGSTSREYHIQGPRSRSSRMTDSQLDDNIRNIMQNFSLHGREMVQGYLLGEGEVVPMPRIRQSIVRVNGPPIPFGYRERHRQAYNVPGANSLWHHDGQHGKPWISCNTSCELTK